MKKIILSCFLSIVKWGMNAIYLIIKLFPMQDNKITMLSRQSNQVNVDFEMLIDEIKQKYPETQIKTLCQKIPEDLMGKVKYCFYMIKCLYHIATSRICFVDGYVIPISLLKHKKDLIVIQIWHAMGAIKQFGMQVVDKKEGSGRTVANIMNMHKNYTNIMCVSEKTREFYAKGFGTEEDKILVLGMPRIDYLLGKDQKIDQKVEKLVEQYPILKEKKNIVYVPTFRKGKSTHIYNLVNAVDKTKYNLIVRLHPLEETKIDEQYTMGKEYQTFDILKIADYVITDYSAVAFEAGTLNKPVLFYLYDIEEYQENRGLNVNLKQEMPHSTFKNIENIIQIIEQGTYDIDELKRFREKYIETLDIHNAERIIQYVMKKKEKQNERRKANS